MTNAKRSFGLLTFWALIGTMALLPSGADAADDILLPYAVHINRTPQQPWPGYGIYLGNGLIITAAHVVGRAFETKPHVLIAGQDLPATVVKEGDFEGSDLTLLAVEQISLPDRLRLRRLTLCQKAPLPGEEVIVVIPEGTARSRIVSPKVLSPDMSSRFDTLIRDVATTGNSGSGVFDARTKCLWGIMSRKIQTARTINEKGNLVRQLNDVAKYFVSSAKIADFIPPNTHF